MIDASGSCVQLASRVCLLSRATDDLRLSPFLLERSLSRDPRWQLYKEFCYHQMLSFLTFSCVGSTLELEIATGRLASINPSDLRGHSRVSMQPGC